MGETVAFIPLRGGSKSIKNKNIKLLAGKPLAYWAISAAAKCSFIDKVYVSTDSDIIAETVNNFNLEKVKVIPRSAESASDTASTEFALLEFCEAYNFDNVFLIQATSPMLTSKDLTSAFKMLGEKGADSLLSVVKQKRFIWKYDGDYAVASNYDYMNRPRRQEYEGYFVENGSFYLSTRENILKSGNRLTGNIALYEMPEESYYEIDEPADWIIVEKLLMANSAVSNDEVLKAKLKQIKLLATDVDGVLTDAGMYYSETGDELKKFNTKDGKGFELIRNLGLKTAIVTTEDTKIVANRAKKLKIDYLYQACTDKVSIITQLAEASGFQLHEIAFIGDDLNDYDALKIVGFSATPNDACNPNKQIVDYICSKKGGEGCVRELCEMLIEVNT